MFDLDQTLIRAEALDWRIWLEVIAGTLGRTVPEDEDWASYPVHTDHGLLDAISMKYRRRSVSMEERMVFERHLAARVDCVLAEQPDVFGPVHGASELLAALTGRVALATGNLHAVTNRKLRSAKLEHHRVPCSCSQPGIDRAQLVGIALERLGWAAGKPATSFGDAVWDVRAAGVLGIGFVGVAQSDAHEERLRAAGARHVVRDYLEIDAVMSLIDSAHPPGPEATPATWLAPREG